MACTQCQSPNNTTHETNQHSEDWVNLADARQTGELIFMPAGVITEALDYSISEPFTPSMNPFRWCHVDRRVIQALIVALQQQYTSEADHHANKLVKLLEANPVRIQEDE
jgi:hypothetical protein